MAKRVVLAYSGGLDTSVAVRWMIENLGTEVVCMSADIGQEGTLEGNREKALGAGAIAYEELDLRAEFARDFLAPVIRANALYEQQYPLVSALSRPLIVKHQVELARKYGADGIAHGCTGKGNDQVRFEVAAMALAPDLELVAPVRNWGFTREDSIEYAAKHSIPVDATKEKLYSIDDNLWGRAIECGEMEDPWAEPPAGVWQMTVPTATEPTELTISFERGVPVAVDGTAMPLHELVVELNQRVGSYGWGRLDMVENRRVGIKSREVYEAPG
ncbi:MAG TPA: argininosuccinate synthase, partial [Microthrixaceae bacterium]|nr:argininosuccinate synthase [Microthrixaceae bacterium]